MKYKIFMIVSIVLLLALTVVTVFAGESDATVTLSDVGSSSEQKSDVYSILYDCWQYILPDNVIRDNANLITLLTILATSLVIYVPIFLCVWLLIRRR